MCANTAAKTMVKEDSEKTPTTNNSSSLFAALFSLPNLALLWFILCTVLVSRRNDLIVVFFGFAGSFVVNAAIKQSAARRSSSLVGILTCGLSVLLLYQHVFESLAIMTGYLAFYLWHEFLYSPHMNAPHVATIWQDAVTLTAFVVILSHYKHWLVENTNARLYVGLWIAYKLSSLLLEVIMTKDNKNMSTTTSAATSSAQKLMQLDTTANTSEHLWTIRGVSYDLRDFVDRHPGGREAILLGQGRPDCTALFESYHPFTRQHEAVLQKYAKKTQQVRQDDEFYNLLKQRVADVLRNEYHMDPVKDRGAPPLRVAYYCLITACLSVCFVYHVKGYVLGSFLLAVFGWLIGALGHDAGHFAVSRTPWINDVCVWAMSLICNPCMWQHQHTYAHHSHTNEFELDPDLHHFDLMLRVHRRFYKKDQYKLQKSTWFVVLAYTLVVFGTCIWIPWGMIQSGSLYGLAEWTDRKRKWRAVLMWAHLLVYVGVIMVLPFFVCSSIWKATLAFLLHMATSGLLFAIFSQINHLNEASLEPDKTQRKSIAITSWAADQVETSNNFASSSRLWHVLSNGLNLQIEHHLFPGLNHAHLHLIVPVVRETCEEYGVMYKSYETWSDLMGATLKWLDTLSDAPSINVKGTDEILRNR